MKGFPDFLEFKSKTGAVEQDGADGADTSTPEDLIAQGYSRHRSALVEELKQQLQKVSPAFFEKVVVDVLLAMGYGGTLKEAGQTLGRTGDGGVDGVIKEDKLGLDVVYVQAKKWDACVCRKPGRIPGQ